MRDPNRLYNFYIEIANLHAKRYPDLREGQMWELFANWIKVIKKKDPFYIESDDMLALFKEFVGE